MNLFNKKFVSVLCPASALVKEQDNHFVSRKLLDMDIKQFFSSFGKGSGSSDAPIIKPRHWYSLELDVTCQVVKLIEDPEFSSKAVPIYDLVYLASSPAAQVRRIPDIALKLAEPNQMQSQTRIVAEGIAVPNEYVIIRTKEIQLL